MDADFPARVIEFLPDATFAIDTGGRVTVWNRAMEELTGVSAAEMLGKGNFEYAIPFYGEHRPILIDLVLRSDGAIDKDYTNVRRSEGCLIAEITDARPRGEQVILWAEAQVIRDRDGETIGVIESIRDITDRKRTEEESARQTKIIEAMLDGIPDIVGMQLPDHTILRYNRAGYEALGRDPQEVNGKKCYELIGRTAPCDICATSRAVATKETETVEKFVPELQRYFICTSAPVIGDDGEVELVIERLHDITDRMEMEEKLRESEEYIRTVLDNLPIGVAVNSVDPAVEFTYYNEKFLEIYRTTAEALAGSDAFWKAVYTDPDIREDIRERVLEDCASGDPERMHWEENPITRPGEETTYISARDIPIPDKDLVVSTVWDVTDQVRAREALREREEEYRRLVELAQEGIWAIDADGYTTYANPRMAEMLGYTVEEMTGRHLFSFMDDEARERARKDIERREQGVVETHEFIFRRRDGEPIVTSLATGPIMDEAGTYRGAIAVVTDITDRKQKEEELRRSEERFHAIIEDQTEFICRFLPDGTHLFVNEAYAAYFDMSPEELVGRSFRPTIHPDDRTRLKDHFASLSPDHPVDSIEHRIIMPGGEVRWQWWNDRAIFDDQGILAEYQSVGRDITDRKQAEEALEENRRQLEEAMDLAHMAHWEFDIASGIFTFNDRFYALYATTAEREGGYQMPAEVYAREFVPPDDRHVVADEVEKARETRDPRFMSRIEHRIIRRDGEIRSIVVRIGVSLDEAGRPVKTHGVNQDITERREAEEELQQEKDLFESTFESLQDAAFVLGADPVVIRMANAAAEEIFGYSRDEMVGRTTGFLHVDEAALARFHEHVYPFLERGEPIPRFRFTMKRKDDTVFPTEHAMTPLYDPEGAHTGWVSLVRDITPEVEAERREEQAMRQLEENLEQLATLNDQIRNPLAVIVGLVDMDCPGIIGAVMEQAERIDDIITRLDAGWVRSEKTWEFLHRHYHLGDETSELQGSDTEDRE